MAPGIPLLTDRSTTAPKSRIVLPAVRSVLEAADGERGPAGLMAGADAAAVVAVEIFVEEHEILEMRIGA